MEVKFAGGNNFLVRLSDVTPEGINCHGIAEIVGLICISANISDPLDALSIAAVLRVVAAEDPRAALLHSKRGSDRCSFSLSCSCNWIDIHVLWLLCIGGGECKGEKGRGKLCEHSLSFFLLI